MTRVMNVAMLIVWFSRPSRDGFGSSVMALIIQRPTIRNLFHDQQLKQNCCRIPLSVHRRRSFSPCASGATNRINQRLLPLTSTDQPFTDGTMKGQNMTVWPVKAPRRGMLSSIPDSLALPLSLQSWLVGLVTGTTTTRSENGGRLPLSMRPGWARDWMPTWVTCLRPSVQLLASLLLYLFHTLVLTQVSIPLPFQLIPNERGNFQTINLDS
jgi:hypothetical protein